MSAYSLPTTNQLLDEIAASYGVPPAFDPETMVTVAQVAARLGLKDSRARAILAADTTLEAIKVRLPNGHPATAWRKKESP